MTQEFQEKIVRDMARNAEKKEAAERSAKIAREEAIKAIARKFDCSYAAAEVILKRG